VRFLVFVILSAITYIRAVSQSTHCSYPPMFNQIPTKVLAYGQNLMALDMMYFYSDLLIKSAPKNAVLFHFFIDENSSLKKKAEDFVQVLKDSLSKAKTDIQVVFRVQKTTGTLFLNQGQNKYPIIGMNALVYSKDSLLLRSLFGSGNKARIDTTNSKVRKFNHEFIPIQLVSGSNLGYLFLFRTRLIGAGFACNPNEDKEIASILKLIYKKKCK